MEKGILLIGIFFIMLIGGFLYVAPQINFNYLKKANGDTRGMLGQFFYPATYYFEKGDVCPCQGLTMKFSDECNKAIEAHLAEGFDEVRFCEG